MIGGDLIKSKKIEQLIIAILLPLAVGLISGLITRNNVITYSRLIKPPLSPPANVFPVVWTILYILMGISSYLFNICFHIATEA